MDLPVESLYFFTKIDLIDAFQAVLIHPTLRSLFDTLFLTEEENKMVYEQLTKTIIIFRPACSKNGSSDPT